MPRFVGLGVMSGSFTRPDDPTLIQLSRLYAHQPLKWPSMIFSAQCTCPHAWIFYEYHQHDPAFRFSDIFGGVVTATNPHVRGHAHQQSISCLLPSILPTAIPAPLPPCITVKASKTPKMWDRDTRVRFSLLLVCFPHTPQL